MTSSLELLSQNWFFISKNVTRSFLRVPVSLRIVLFCQISGQSRLRLLPIKECSQNCQTKRLTLKPGQMCKNSLKKHLILILKNLNFQVIYSDLWQVEFKPLTNAENMVLVLLVH